MSVSKTLFIFALGINLSLQYSYKAAIIEYVPNEPTGLDDAKEYIEDHTNLTKIAAGYGANIVIFPKYHQNNMFLKNQMHIDMHMQTAATKKIQCNDETILEILKRLSCQAIDSSVYIVIQNSFFNKNGILTPFTEFYNGDLSNIVFKSISKKNISTEYLESKLNKHIRANSSYTEVEFTTTEDIDNNIGLVSVFAEDFVLKQFEEYSLKISHKRSDIESLDIPITIEMNSYLTAEDNGLTNNIWIKLQFLAFVVLIYILEMM